MARNQQLTDEQRQLLQAQIAQTYGETAAQREKLALAARELEIRQAQQQAEAGTAQAETARKAELTPYEKLLSLYKMSEGDTTERMNTIRSAVDLMGQRERASTAQAQIAGQLQERNAMIEAQKADRAAASKANLQDAFITHYATLAQLPKEQQQVFAQSLRDSGLGGYADVLDKESAREGEKQFQVLKSQVPAMQQKGQLDTFLAGVSPEMQERLKPFITEATQKPVADASKYPGYIGSEGFKSVPIHLMNFARTGENVTAIPFMNLLNSVVGAPPIPRKQMLPNDYQKAIAILGQGE